MIVYKYTNVVSGRAYYGITINIRQRHYSHASAVRLGVKTPFYDAVRKYGWKSFNLSISNEMSTEAAQVEEIILIALTNNYNLHRGGSIGFNMLTKPEDEQKVWKSKLKEARKGRTPAQGLVHSEETKLLCGAYGRLRWDLYGRYPADVVQYSFKDSKKTLRNK